MPRSAIILLVLAILAGVLDFTGGAGEAASAVPLFLGMLFVLLAASLLFARRKPPIT